MISEKRSFEAHLLARNYSPHTVEDYGYSLKDFIGFLLTQGVSDVRGITTTLITDYQVHRMQKLNPQGKPCGVGSRNSVLKAVKAFCRYLHKQGFIGDDPARDVDFARMPRGSPAMS